MATGLCPLCINPGDLRESHIIPNAYFRAMKRERTGRLISFDSLPTTLVRLSNESWSEQMLCEQCEGNLSKLETKCIVSLRKTAREIEVREEYGTLLNSFDFEVLSRFLMSVLWRAAISKQVPFDQIFLEPNVQEEIRLSLLDPPAPVTKLVHCQVLKIRDASRKISATRWEGVAASPILAIQGQTAIYTFVFAGYLVGRSRYAEQAPKPMPCRVRLGLTLPIVARETRNLARGFNHGNHRAADHRTAGELS